MLFDRGNLNRALTFYYGLMEWNPRKSTIEKIFSLNQKKAFKVFRNASSNFTNKIEVRKRVFELNGRLCHVCEEKFADQIDHVKSVYSCFHANMIFECNTIENLKPICKKCNCSKKP